MSRDNVRSMRADNASPAAPQPWGGGPPRWKPSPCYLGTANKRPPRCGAVAATARPVLQPLFDPCRFTASVAPSRQTARSAGQGPGLGGRRRHPEMLPSSPEATSRSAGFSGLPPSAHPRGIRAGPHRAQTAPGYAGFVFHTDPVGDARRPRPPRPPSTPSPGGRNDGTFGGPLRRPARSADGIFRHVSPAFAEDPVRILRLARFAAARFADFRVALKCG